MRHFRGIDHEALYDEIVVEVAERKSWPDSLVRYEVRLGGHGGLWFPVRSPSQRPQVGDTVVAHVPALDGVVYVVPLDAPGDEPSIDRDVAFAAAEDDYFHRCQSRNLHSSPWVVEVRAASGVLGMMDIRARCTLPAGHAGDHIGPDDVTWPQEQEEPDP